MAWQFIKPNRPVHYGGFNGGLQSSSSPAPQGIKQIIEFTDSSDLVKGACYQTRLLDIALWDQYWQQDPCNFVPNKLAEFPHNCCETHLQWQQEVTMHRQKIQRWQTELQHGGQVPAVCFQHRLHNGRLRILQGRHRIAYLRSIGIPAFAAAIPCEHLHAIKPLQYLDF